MQVTGYQIREAIKRWTLKREMSVQVFDDAGFAFPGDVKPSPLSAMLDVQRATVAVAELEAMQQEFNQHQTVSSVGGQIKLAVAIKMVSGVARCENLWRAYAGEGLLKSNKRRGYHEHDPMVREEGEIRAVRQSPVQECIDRAGDAAAEASSLRSGIAQANSKTMFVDDNKGWLFG